MVKKMTPNLRLTSLRLEEEQAQYYIERALQVFDANLIGPQQYVALYAKYVDLLTAKAEREAEEFLTEPHTIDEMKAVSYMHARLLIYLCLLADLTYGRAYNGVKLILSVCL